MINTEYPIDAVVTWVDGNDPAHKAKRAMYGKKDERRNDDIGGDIRYTSVGEIKYCIASLLRFAPFLRTIWLITDNQDPMIWDFLEQHFPGQSSKVKIVDHTVLYRGYSQYLPVFNSLSIETVMWCIPGLSEHFIYLNDDFMLVAPTTPSDYFVGEKAVCYAMWFSLPFANLLQFLKPKKNGHKVFTFKHSMVNAATAIGEKWRFFRLGHNPQSMKVSTFSKFFEEHPDLMISNMSCRFREQHQYNPAELFFLLSAKEDKLILHTKKGVNLYLLPKGHKYMESHIQRFRNSTTEKFCCMNSLDYAAPEDQKLALDWLEERLGLR